ncbi:MAG: hypothetical protein J3K34DRAFT_400151 [Monoraphidium minutum]|nr:MAG: hypothetical protein J3K34DRAFT_400151 [Monoraphidium minutum]
MPSKAPLGPTNQHSSDLECDRGTMASPEPAQTVRALRLMYVDLAGVRRCRVVPWSGDGGGGEGGAAPLPQIALTFGSMGTPVHVDCVLPASGLSATGEAVLTPDAASLVPRLPWWPAHGLANVDHLERAGGPWDCCPRSALRHCLGLLEARHGLSLLVGFELEFVLLRELAPAAAAGHPHRVPGTCYVPVEVGPYSSSSGLDEFCEVLDAMVSALQAMGIEVVQWHKESGPGQFEIATGPADALAAADRLLQAKEAIAAVARRHGLAVTFVPKPFPGEAGSGCHAHMSLWKGGVSVMAEERPGATAPPFDRRDPLPLPAEASAFFAGILSHLPALLPFTAPSAGAEWGSFARVRPGCWAGAFACWGWDNREAPLRATRPGGPASTNVEYKAFDGTANPYVALAALVCAGMLGLAEGAGLPPPLQGDPGGGGGGGGAAALPGSLSEALAAWHGDAPLCAAVREGLGAPLVRAFMAVRAGELEAAPSLAHVLLRY